MTIIVQDEDLQANNNPRSVRFVPVIVIERIKPDEIKQVQDYI